MGPGPDITGHVLVVQNSLMQPNRRLRWLKNSTAAKANKKKKKKEKRAAQTLEKNKKYDILDSTGKAQPRVSWQIQCISQARPINHSSSILIEYHHGKAKMGILGRVPGSVDAEVAKNNSLL